MLIIHCGRLKKPLCCSAFKFSTSEVKPQYKLAKYAWQCSCCVGDPLYTGGKTVLMLQLNGTQGWDSKFFNEQKTITTVIQMYSNSLQSQSIQTPKKCCHRYKPLVYICKLFWKHRKTAPGFFHHATVVHRRFNLSVWRWWKRCGMRILFPKAGPSPRLITSSFDPSMATEQLHSSDLLEHSVRNNNGFTHHVYVTMETKHTPSSEPQRPNKHTEDHWDAVYLPNCKRTIKWEIMSAMLHKLLLVCFCRSTQSCYSISEATPAQSYSLIQKSNTNLQTEINTLFTTNKNAIKCPKPGSCRREIILHVMAQYHFVTTIKLNFYKWCLVLELKDDRH